MSLLIHPPLEVWYYWRYLSGPKAGKVERLNINQYIKNFNKDLAGSYLDWLPGAHTWLYSNPGTREKELNGLELYDYCVNYGSLDKEYPSFAWVTKEGLINIGSILVKKYPELKKECSV